MTRLSRLFSGKRKWFILGAGIAIAAVAFLIIRQNIVSHSFYTVKRIDFEKLIETKGEVQGKTSINIVLPDVFKDQELRIYELQIKDMVAEGTIVKKGDWVATLDAGRINQLIQSNREEMERYLAEVNDARIDSAIELTRLRQGIKEMTFNLEYKKIDLEQSRFESPAYQRRAKAAYNQTLRQIEKQKRDYELRKMGLEMRTKREEARYNYTANIDKKLQEALTATRVIAPADGMIIYARSWGRRKIRVGDQVSPWQPAIATLPDLSQLVSETYIQEIDVAKISQGDSVRIAVDAVPGHSFKGTIVNIANVGQELAGFDGKVFRVLIDLADVDKKLKPAMTTTNLIILEKIPAQLTIPRTCLFAENGVPYVYVKQSGKVWKKAVKTGPENDEMVVITEGLAEREKILLHEPENIDEIPFLAQE